jgi:hypothetical protein
MNSAEKSGETPKKIKQLISLYSQMPKESDFVTKEGGSLMALNRPASDSNTNITGSASGKQVKRHFSHGKPPRSGSRPSTNKPKKESMDRAVTHEIPSSTRTPNPISIPKDRNSIATQSSSLQSPISIVLNVTEGSMESIQSTAEETKAMSNANNQWKIGSAGRKMSTINVPPADSSAQTMSNMLWMAKSLKASVNRLAIETGLAPNNSLSASSRSRSFSKLNRSFSNISLAGPPN